MMSDEMSERATDIAESTVINDESMQALSMMQIRDLSERMTDGCPIRWRIDGGSGGWMSDKVADRVHYGKLFFKRGGGHGG